MTDGAYIRRTAVQLLLDTKISELPVDPFLIAERLNIPVISFGEVKKAKGEKLLDDLANQNGVDAFCCSPKGTPIIFFDETVTPKDRIRFSLAHELGHIVLKHIHVKETYPRSKISMQDPIEQEADIFAAELLTPQGLLFATGLYRFPGEIKKVFGVSYSVAKNRSERLKTFQHKYVNKLEDQLYHQITLIRS